MSDEQSQTASQDQGAAGVGGQTAPASDSDGGSDQGPNTTSGDGGEDKRTKPAEDKILRDPRTGQPLRDQTPAAKDTGYLGKHNMQDDTERAGAADGPAESDFQE